MNNVIRKQKTSISIFNYLLNRLNYLLKKRSIRVFGKLHSKHVKKHPNVAIFAYDAIGLLIQFYGIYEKNLLNGLSQTVFNKIDLDNSICLDIGANIGNHSLYFSEYFKSVYSFEPHPDTFTLLEFNARKKSNINCFNFGGSNIDKEDIISVRKNTINMGTASVNHTDTNNNFDKFNIKLKKIDNFIDSSVSFVKIDVEGHELKALQGLQNSLEKYSPIVSFEQHNSDFYNDSDTQVLTSSSIDYLKQQGYRYFFEIEQSKDWKWSAKADNKIITRIIHLSESVILGVPTEAVYKLKLIQKFNKRTYDLIISSKSLL